MAIQVRGLSEAIRDLREMADHARDLSPWAASVASRVEATTREAFSRQASPSGESWDPPSRASSQPLLSGVARTVYAEGHSTGVRFGARDDAAGYHQRGTRHVPRRAFLPVVAAAGGWALMATGAAGALWDSARDELVRYLRGRL